MTSKGDPKPGKARPATVDETTLANVATPFSRVIKIDDIPDMGLEIPLRADAAERAAVAESAGLIAVESLEADLVINKQSDTKFRVAGPLRARIAQTCVVSLEPFDSEIHAEVEADFAVQIKKKLLRPGSVARREHAIDDPPSSAAAQFDAPDPIIDGRIDLGVLVMEFFVLNLDPYPRKPGVRFEGAEFSGSPDETASPFAILKKH